MLLLAQDNECTGDAFSSIPDSMFYTAVFLAGEWAETDFTWPGKILCMFLCVMGIALFAIPVGTVFEAFQDVLQEVHTEGEKEGEGGVELTEAAGTGAAGLQGEAARTLDGDMIEAGEFFRSTCCGLAFGFPSRRSVLSRVELLGERWVDPFETTDSSQGRAGV